MSTFQPIFVAEVKTQSPFGFKSKYEHSALLDYAIRFGDMISIHTDERWGGNFRQIRYCAAVTKKPILAKGIHATDDEIQQALDCGADRVLVVGRIPADKYLDKIWYEPSTLQDLLAAPRDLKLVWNRRDLTTGSLKPMYLHNTIYTDHMVINCWDGWICQASYIERPTDVIAGANAFIVGQHLPEFIAKRF